MRKVLKCLRRICGKHCSAHEENDKVGVVCSTQKIVAIFAERILTYSENTQKVYLNTYEENAKRKLLYSPNAPRDIKLSQFRRIFDQNLNILDLRSST
jgi:hypothetical protein